jgi:cell division protein FtsQ
VRAGAAILSARPRISLAALAPPPRLRWRLLVLALAATALAAGYQFWLRDSSLVRVDQVRVTGLSTNEAPRVRQALTAAARSMTTLHVDRDRLLRVAGRYPVVRTIDLSPDFPHTLRIRVVEQRPVVVAAAGRARVPLAGDGSVLRGLPADRALPVVHLRGALPPERVSEGPARLTARVMGAAPPALLGRLEGVRTVHGRGLTVVMRHGPDLIFGTPRRLHAKWAAAARVLADPAARGASYIDVRLPGRPAAGGVQANTVSPVAPPSEPAPMGPVAPAPAVPQSDPVQPQATQPQATQPPVSPPPSQVPQRAPAAPPPPTGTAGGGATANPQP